MRYRTCVVVLAFSLLSVVSAGPKEGRYDIAHIGCFHGNEVVARSGQRWSALFQNGRACELAEVTISVDSCRDQIVDEPGQKTGRSIRIAGGRSPLVLVRGLTEIGPQPIKIETAVRVVLRVKDPQHKDGYLRPGDRIRLKLGRSHYVIAATGAYDPSRPDYDRIVIGYRLRVTNPEGRVQDLEVPPRFAEDGFPAILWAGDLDRDGKLDLYMDIGSRENVRGYALFLSSRASGKRFLKLVASRSYVGC